MTQETFRRTFPTQFIEDNTQPGSVSGTSISTPYAFVVREVDPEWATAVRLKALESGWDHYAGSAPEVPEFAQAYSDTTTTVPPLGTWLAPDVTTEFAGVLTIAAANEDLITVAEWLATVKERVVEHDSEIVINRRLINKILDILQSYGMAT